MASPLVSSPPPSSSDSSSLPHLAGNEADGIEGPPAVALAGLVAMGLHGALFSRSLDPGVPGSRRYRSPRLSASVDRARHPRWISGALTGTTFYVRRRIGARRWRRIHQATVVVYVLAVLHSLGSGTDGASLWFRAMVVGSAVPILALLLMRYGRRRAGACPPTPIGSRPSIAANAANPTSRASKNPPSSP